jgi:hypothetical protein
MCHMFLDDGKEGTLMRLWHTGVIEEFIRFAESPFRGALQSAPQLGEVMLEFTALLHSLRV